MLSVLDIAHLISVIKAKGDCGSQTVYCSCKDCLMCNDCERIRHPFDGLQDPVYLRYLADKVEIAKKLLI